MKFSTKTSDFLHASQLVSRAIGGDQVLPILQNILISVEGGQCTMSATNLELSIVTHFPVSIESEGSITVPAKALLNFVQYNQDPEVIMEVKEGTRLHLHSKRARSSIAGELSSNFPAIPNIEKITHVELPTSQLLDALNLVTFSCAKTTSRPVIAGVSFRMEPGVVTLAGTDSYRLSEYVMKVPNVTASHACIIPARFLDELKAVLAATRENEKKKDESTSTITAYFTAQQIEVTAGNTRIVSRLIEGKFPDYRQVLPKECACTVTTSVRELLAAVKRMHYFAKEQSNNITFHCSGGTIHLSTRQTQIGKDESTIPAAMEGNDAKIAISSLYLIDFLSRIHGDVIVLKLLDHLHPVVLHIPGTEQYLHLIMPLRMVEE